MLTYYMLKLFLFLFVLLILYIFNRKKKINYEKFISKAPLTCVSSFYYIKNKHNNKFEKWFKNTLSINCPYVFFTDKKSIDIIKKYRKGFPTHYIILDIKNFNTYKYRNLMKTDNYHCPSVELNLIWNEKIFMIQKAFDLNVYNSEYFMWIDAGICIYRNNTPPSVSFPNINKLNKLPKDKFIYCSSNPKFNVDKFKKGKYHLYHHISGVYILHKNIINKVVDLYSKYLNLIDKNDIWTDQVILTHMYKDNKELFYKYSNNYGSIIKYLY